MSLGRHALPLILLLIGGACQGGRDQAAPAVDSAAIAAAHQGVPAMDPDVRLAAGITLAIRAHPEMRDSMFAAYKITPAGLDSIKALIAADSAKNAAYTRLVEGHRPAPAAS